MAFRAALRPLSDDRASAAPSDVLGIGCAPFGNLFTPVTDEQVTETVQTALAADVRFFDTAPHYGAGESERRLGAALASTRRDQVVIATKVGRRVVDDDGRDVRTGGIGVDTQPDLSRDGVMRSLESSLRRLATDRIDLLYLHDPVDVDEALREAMPALIRLRDERVVRAIGVGMVWPDPLARFVRECDLDVVMIAGRTTLLDRRAERELLPSAEERGVGVIAAGVYNSGILADPITTPYFDYRLADEDMLRHALELQSTAAAHGVTLAHAAARYPLRLRAVEAVVIGARSPGEVTAAVEAMHVDIGDELWSRLA